MKSRAVIGTEANFRRFACCIKAVLPGMRERRHGCIVNVTSIAGRIAMAPAAPYATGNEIALPPATARGKVPSWPP
jgi:NADP-dependent 3-hydroxy acid dehydrogenase YdfG